jgi:hypothetical protein
MRRAPRSRIVSPMSRRTLLPLAALAAVAAASPATAAAAPKPVKRATPAQWVIQRVFLDGVVRTEEDDRGYTGTASYRGLARPSAPFALTPGTAKRPRLLSVVVPVSYEGSSRAVITQLDGSWDCSSTMAGAMVPRTLPLVVTVTARTVHFNLGTVPPGIECPENAPAWTFEQISDKAKKMEVDLRRLAGAKRGGMRNIPVHLTAKGSDATARWEIRWSGWMLLKRVR